jgi:flagellar biosynthesis protein FlhG
MEVEVKRSHKPPQVSRVMSFTSGKGGVGKTSMVVNLGVALADIGKSVLILDADLGLANVDVLLGLRPKYTLLDLFEGRRSLEEIIVNGPKGISIIPAASGVESICNLNAARKLLLMQAVENMAYGFDYLLLDTQAGIGPDVIYFNTASAEVICVINSEPTSLTDAYALIKVLAKNYGERSFSIISNNVASEKEGLAAFNRLRLAVERFLQVELNYLGHVPSDPALPDSVRSQQPLMELFPSSRAALALAALARRIDSDFHEFRIKGGMQFFFRQLLEMGVGGGE